MAAATETTRHVSFAPATPVKDEPGFPILERRFSEIGQYISDASNVLIAASGHVKLADFGLSSSKARRKRCGTLPYTAPEVQS